MTDPDFRICRLADDSDEVVLRAVSEPLWPLWVGFLDQDEDPKKIAVFFGQLNDGQRHILAVAICRSEVANGGVDQFFITSTGMLWPQVLEGLRTIRPMRYAKLLEKVPELFPNSKAPIRTKARNDIMDSLPEDKTEKLFESVNEKWDELDSSDNQNLAVCARYGRSNPSYFFIQ